MRRTPKPCPDRRRKWPDWFAATSVVMNAVRIILDLTTRHHW